LTDLAPPPSRGGADRYSPTLRDDRRTRRVDATGGKKSDMFVGLTSGFTPIEVLPSRPGTVLVLLFKS